jgi:hypothetical protein
MRRLRDVLRVAFLRLLRRARCLRFPVRYGVVTCPFFAPCASAAMDGAVAAFDAFYARADGVIKPAVFSTLDKLGWHLTPSAFFRPCGPLLPRTQRLRAARRAAAPVTKGLPFVDSPTGLLLCLAAYFVIVVFGVAVQAGRPAVAADSKRTDPAWLRAIVLLHNLFLVGLSLFMSGGCACRARRSASCKPTPQTRRARPRQRQRRARRRR